jgi:SAM-dependent methyltransferase
MINTRYLGRRLVAKLQQFVYAPMDTYDLLRGTRPPKQLIFVGDGSWRAVGNEFLRYFRSIGELRPDEQVLDVGCGVGRMAVPLTRYLKSPGGYEGFDIVEEGIVWCRDHLTPRYPRFHFQHVPVFNKHYNPGGTVAASKFVFPFADASFDFVFLTSVFTHMLPVDLEHYAGQIARVLRPGGRVFATFFLIDDVSRAAMLRKESAFAFECQTEGHYIADPKDPEAVVAFDVSTIREILQQHGLYVQDPIHFGGWCGRRPHLSFQDIVLARKH